MKHSVAENKPSKIKEKINKKCNLYNRFNLPLALVPLVVLLLVTLNDWFLSFNLFYSPELVKPFLKNWNRIFDTGIRGNLN